MGKTRRFFRTNPIGGIASLLGSVVLSSQEGACMMRKNTTVLAVVALTLFLLPGHLTNTMIMPQNDMVAAGSREIGALGNIVFNVIVAMVATRRPALLAKRWLAPGAVILFYIGKTVSLVAVQLGWTDAFTISVTVAKAALAWVAIVMLVACSCFPKEVLYRAVPLSVALAFGLGLAMHGAPEWLVQGVQFACPLVFLWVARSRTPAVLDAMAAAPPPADAALSRPSSFLPLNHKVFICFFLFRLADGFGYRFGETAGEPLSTPLAFVAIGLLALWFVFSQRSDALDTVYLLSTMAVIAGFMFIPVFGTSEGTVIVSTTLRCGSLGFDIVFWLFVLTAAQRNELMAVGIFAWSSAVIECGMIAGANIGVFANASGGRLWTTAAATLVALVLLGYTLFAMKRYSFSETIAGISPYVPVVVKSEESTLEDTCGQLAVRFALTPREAEVFGLLARGRNNSFIQQELFLSRNTVKGHIKHVYTKLGVHSQQELIDLVEADVAGAMIS